MYKKKIFVLLDVLLFQLRLKSFISELIFRTLELGYKSRLSAISPLSPLIVPSFFIFFSILSFQFKYGSKIETGVCKMKQGKRRIRNFLEEIISGF